MANDDNVPQDRTFLTGDIVEHFKRELNSEGSMYMYKIIALAENTETKENMVVYQALYAPFKIYVRPYDMFVGKVEKDKYPTIERVYRFTKINI